MNILCTRQVLLNIAPNAAEKPIINTQALICERKVIEIQHGQSVSRVFAPILTNIN